jgi:hypothetical protein
MQDLPVRPNVCLTAELAQGPEGGLELLGEQLGFFPGGEVAALVGLVEVAEGGIGLLDPAARGLEDLAREAGEADRDLDLGRGLAGRRGAGGGLSAVPLRPGRRGPGAGQPVQGDVVQDVVAGEIARGLAVEKGPGDLVVAVGVVVQHPAGQGDGGIQQGIADRLGPGGLLQEVAKPLVRKVVSASRAARSCSESAGGGPWPAIAADESRLRWMPSSPVGAWRPMASVTMAPTSPPWAT